MKRFAMTTLFVGALAMGFSAQPASAQVTVQVTIGRFYRELAPYGRWINCRYGRCWVPARVARRWQPYTHGRWVYTDYGWTWVSNDPWGSTPYHYGTWTSIRGYGWVWVPGTVWAPSWVTWSYSDRYVGWAPLPPSVVFGESGYSGRPVVVSQTQYVFVPMNRFVDTDIDSVRVSAQESASIFRQTTPVTSFAVSGGIVRNMAIPMETVQRARGGGRIETRNISEARTAPGSMAEGRGTSRQVSVVAPARDVNAAVAAAPKAESRPAQRQQAAPAEPRQQRQQAAPAVPRKEKPQAAPAESRQQRQQAAPAAPRKEKPQAAPAEPRQQRQQAAPAEPRQQQPRAGAEKPAPAPPPAAQAGQPKPRPGHEEPAKKEKDKKGKDEKQ